MVMSRAAEDPSADFFSDMNPDWLMQRNPNRNPDAYIPSNAAWAARLGMEYDPTTQIGSPMWWGEQEGMGEEERKRYEHYRERWKETMKRKRNQARIRGIAMIGALAAGGAALGAASGGGAAAGSAAAGAGGATGAGAGGAAAAGGAGAAAGGASAAALPAGFGTAGGLGVGAGVGGVTGAGVGSGAAVGAGVGGGIASGTTALGATSGGLTLSQGLKYANAAQQAYGAYEAAQEQKKLAKDAAKDKTRTQYHTPYYNEALAPLMQYFLQEAQKIYANRLQQYGLKPGDYSPYSALLSGIPLNYSGVGQPGSAQMNQTWR